MNRLLLILALLMPLMSLAGLSIAAQRASEFQLGCPECSINPFSYEQGEESCAISTASRNFGQARRLQQNTLRVNLCPSKTAKPVAFSAISSYRMRFDDSPSGIYSEPRYIYSIQHLRI